jgi:hypothetical protein
MLALARTVTAAITIGILGLAGSGAMPGTAGAGQEQFEERWGDLNCTGEIQSLEALQTLAHVAGLHVVVPEGMCSNKRMGMFPETLLQIEGGPQVQWADVDCNGKISAVDALRILRFVVGLGNPVSAGCPEIGALTTLSFVQ